MKATSGTTYRLRLLDGLGLGVCALMTTGVFLLGVMPMLEQRQEQLALKDQLRVERQESLELANALNAMRRQYTATERAVAHYPLRLEPLSALNQRMSEITSLANRTGLELAHVRPGRAVPGDHYFTIPVHVAGHGSFQTTNVFLHELHHQLPDVAVKSFQMEGRPARQASSPSFQLELVWYASPPPR